MQKKNSTASIVFGAVIIALIAGVSGWSLRSRVAASNPASTDTAGAGDASPMPEAQNAPSIAAQRISQASVPARRPDPRGFLQANEANIAKVANAGQQKLRSQYESEKVDAAWASRKEVALKAASTTPQMEQIGANPLSFDSKCRSSTCLIGADFDSSGTADDWFTLYTLTAASEMTNAAVQRSTNPDGSVHLQIYGKTR